MPLDKVTVTELCRRAHVDRGTFYRHYASRDDLVEKLAERLLDEFNSDIYLRIERIIEGADSREILKLIINSIDAVGSDLVVLQNVKIRGKDVRTRIRHISEGALRVLSSTGILGEDPETEAWAITTIVLDYPVYAAEIGHRTSPATFVMGTLRESVPSRAALAQMVGWEHVRDWSLSEHISGAVGKIGEQMPAVQRPSMV